MIKEVKEATLEDFPKDLDFVVDWINKRTFGIIDEENNRVVINLYLLIADVVVHEFIHHKYSSDLNKAGVNKKTRLMLNRMKVKDIINLANTTLATSEWRKINGRK